MALCETSALPAYDVELEDLIDGLLDDRSMDDADDRSMDDAVAPGQDRVQPVSQTRNGNITTDVTTLPNESSMQCWGAVLKGDAAACTPDFKAGRAHFKNHFCARCRETIEVNASHVRALMPESHHLYVNTLSVGFWKRASPTIGGGDVRVVNNTITCDGPWLVIYREDPPDDLSWAPMPKEWVREGMVHLCVAKGTLVPASEMWPQVHRTALPSYVVSPVEAALPKRQRRAKSMILTQHTSEPCSASGSSLGNSFTTDTSFMNGSSKSFSAMQPEALAMPPPIERSLSCPPSLEQAHAHSSGGAAVSACSSLGVPPTYATHEGGASWPCAMAVSVPWSSNCFGAAARQDADPTRQPLYHCGGCACTYAIPVSVAPQPPGCVASHAAGNELPLLARQQPSLPSPAPASPAFPVASTHVSARSAAELSVMLLEAQERVCELLETNLQPLSAVRCELTPSQADDLANMLTETRGHARKAKQLAAVASPGSVSSLGASVRNAQSPVNVDAEGLAQSSVETDRASAQLRRHSIGEVGPAMSAPAMRGLCCSSGLEELSQEASTRSETGRRHYTDRLRTFSRGDSDSKLGNRPARIKALRQSMQRMFQGLSLHSPYHPRQPSACLG